jgi:hypothetical protein
MGSGGSSSRQCGYPAEFRTVPEAALLRSGRDQIKNSVLHGAAEAFGKSLEILGIFRHTVPAACNMKMARDGPLNR